MTHKLTALVDGSTYSKSVCDHAAWIARRAELDVELMHVLGRREAGGGSDLSGSIALGARSTLLNELSELDEQRAKLALQRGRAILDDAKALLEDAGIAVKAHLRHGDLVEAIAQKETEAEMVLIGKRGEAADFATEHLGSNLDRVMRAVGKPLFVASRAFQAINRVLIAFDGSPSATRAVEYVARSPLYAGLELKVVTFGPTTDAAEKSLANAQATLSAAGRDAKTEIRPGQPDEALGRLIEEERFDHLVMGSSGHTRFRAFFVGSTTIEMLRVCRVPILLVK
ncbi:universal stress protein [Rhodovibrio salinarum]|uniref:Universal stress protein n=1 Tax=Rhodovibrio salinarum TaxID=1087 RepID=A0A934QIH0_9PROT|nr:universal stress protein [Rhodovibrio salinarum]MBK1697175.1 universal stress protein [Rhodovibrio salinarum]